MADTARLLNFNTWIDTVECCNCGVTFGLPASLLKALREDPSRYFYCPNGHSQHFTTNEVERLKAELKNTRENLQREIEWQKGQRKVAEKQLIVKKGQITKLRNRISNGVCPCCHRQFQNVQRHMATKHPDYAQAD